MAFGERPMIKRQDIWLAWHKGDVDFMADQVIPQA
jgi:hypothetical protein